MAFTSVKTSSYAYPNGTNISGLTDIQDIVQSVAPFSAQVFNETMLQVSARFDNFQVQDEYLIQTLGLYAQVESGSPVLFAVIQADTPDQMPAQSAVSPSAFIYNIQMTVQQTTSLNVSVNPAGTATVQDILNLEAAKVDKNGGELADTVTTFDDSGSVSGITSFPEFLATFLSNTKTGIFLRNLKAGLQYVLHVGSIVNDCVTNNPSLPLSAAQGKVLMDGKAPNNHASGAATYGLGNASQYGHVKLSDAYTASAGNAAAGMGASSYALAQAYTVLNTNKHDYYTQQNFQTSTNALGNVAIFRRYPNNMKSFRIYGTVSNKLTPGTEYALGSVGGIYAPYENVSQWVIYTYLGHIAFLSYEKNGDIKFTPYTVPETQDCIMYVFVTYY